jgi:TPR repeat protein
MRAGIAEAKLAAIERAQEECSGLTKEEYRNAGAWLEKAAERGSVPAQLVYVSDPEAVVGDASEMMRDPERVKDYKNKSMRYMQSAANNGSIDAILKLGNAYSAGVLTERDSFKSVAYYSAIGLMDQSLVPQVRFSVLANELTPNQRAAALQQGRKIYEQCCAP